jgi:hypothetical protein
MKAIRAIHKKKRYGINLALIITTPQIVPNVKMAIIYNISFP